MAFFHAAIQLAQQSLPTTSDQPVSGEDTAMTGSSGPKTTWTIPELHTLIQTYISRHSSQLDEHISERRQGRPKSARHLALEQEIATEEGEYASGFWVVDLTDQTNVKLFLEWSGEWGGLGPFRFVRVRRRNGEEGWEGTVRRSVFPPTSGS